MNELAATKFLLRSANELQTDDYATAGRIPNHIVRCCSSVIIHQQYIYCILVKNKEGKFNPPIRPEVSFRNLGSRRGERSRPHPGRIPPGKVTRYALYKRLVGLTPGSVWTFDENVVSTGIRYPDGPVRSNSL